MPRNEEKKYFIDGKRIRRLRESLGLTLEKFGEKIGVNSASQVRSWERNEHVPILSTVVMIRKVYGLDLLSKEEINPSFEKTVAKNSFLMDEISDSVEAESMVNVAMPSDARALAGNYRVNTITEDGLEIVQHKIPRDFLALFDLTGLKNIKIFEVEGDSMEPDLKAGEKAIVDVSSTSLKDGCIYLLRIAGVTYVKKIFHDDEGLRLVSQNSLYPSRLIKKETEVEVVGRVARKIEFRVFKL